MAKINGIIPVQNFEQVRDRICEILAEELANQYDLTGDSEFNPTVWMERTVPFDKTEMPAINVRLNSIDFGNEDVKSSDANCLFYIDCYTSSADTDDSEGDKTAAINLQRIMGIVRAILKNPQYKTLAFTAPFNCTAKINRLYIGDTNTSDALSTTVGRIEYAVRVPENVALLNGTTLGTHSTTVTLGATDKGYYWEFEATQVDTFILENGDFFISEINNNFFIKN